MAQFYPEEVIQEVSNSNDIVEVVSEYVKLKKSGSSLMGLCPFHKEKTPSFSVSPDKQLFHCFGCGAGGTVINFIMRIENLDFIEAIKLLAERAGIDLPEGNYNSKDSKIFEKKERIIKLNLEAARYFFQKLNSPEGQRARDYLAKRQINHKTIVNFGLGYSPKSRDELMNFLLDKGYSMEELVDSGLVVKHETRGYYDRFRDRLMFPIIDLRGRVIGFGGRVLDDSLPKYLNSPETLVFNKSRNLYGLNFAKNSKKNQLIVVEGYMDVISLHQNGIINTVASLGTALTEEQAKLIKRYCHEVVLSYDGDSAGQAATLRGIEVLSEVGCKVKVLTIKEAKDPDEFIRLKGVERFNKLVKDSINSVEYKIQLLRQHYDVNDIEQKIDFVNEMAKIFAGLENTVERDVYIQKISKETGISTEAILSEVKKILYRSRKKMNEPVKKLHTNIQENTVKPKQKSISRLIKAEKMLLNLICYDKATYNKVSKLIAPEDFSEEVHRKLAKIIYETRENDDIIDVIKIVSMFPEEETGVVAGILNNDINFEDNLKAVDDLIRTIKEEKYMSNIKATLKEGNVEKLNTLLQAFKNKKL